MKQWLVANLRNKICWESETFLPFVSCALSPQEISFTLAYLRPEMATGDTRARKEGGMLGGGKV